MGRTKEIRSFGLFANAPTLPSKKKLPYKNVFDIIHLRNRIQILTIFCIRQQAYLMPFIDFTIHMILGRHGSKQLFDY